jgi:hypothetical protein
VEEFLPIILKASEKEGRHARMTDAVRSVGFRLNVFNDIYKLYQQQP